MTKEIKKCFKFLRLPYNATVDDLHEKEQVLISHYKAESVRTGVNHDEDIAFIKIASEKLYDYIINKKANCTFFDVKLADVGTMAFLLAMNLICIVTCFLALVML